MLQKEDKRRLGWALIILSFAMFMTIVMKEGSITGYVVHDEGGECCCFI